MDSEADGNHYIAFAWQDYCQCLPWEEQCHACYEKKVNDFREKMEVARAAIRIVSERQEERAQEAWAGQEAGQNVEDDVHHRRGWSFSTAGSCRRCNIVGIVGDTCDECMTSFGPDERYDEWKVFLEWD